MAIGGWENSHGTSPLCSPSPDYSQLPSPNVFTLKAKGTDAQRHIKGLLQSNKGSKGYGALGATGGGRKNHAVKEEASPFTFRRALSETFFWTLTVTVPASSGMTWSSVRL